MRRQGILRTAAAGILALSLLVTPAALAADAGAEVGVFGFWTSVQSWMQNVLGDIFGTTSQTQVEHQIAPTLDSSAFLPCEDGKCPEKKEPGGTTENDTGTSADPDG